MANQEATSQEDVHEEDIHDRIEKAKSCLKTQNAKCINGPVYASLNKHLAELYLELGQYDCAIFHLTEAHACTLRMQAIFQYDLKDDYFKRETSSKNSKHPYRAQGIDKKYLIYDSEYAKKLEEGLLDRLKEMPKEWTIVQLTREFDPTERWTFRPKDEPPKLSRLHIARLPCGEELKHSSPLCMTVDVPVGAGDGIPTVFDVLYESISKMKYLKTKRSQMYKEREKAGINAKCTVTEITICWLREWRCLLIGCLKDETIRNKIRTSIDSVVSNTSASVKSKNYEISSRDLQLLYCLADGCAHLEESDIKRGVNSIVSDSTIAKNIIQVIMENRAEISQLVVAKRHPVILILDDQLDRIPWEMTPILMRHPVSRVPSLHFVHALYKHHESSIVDGNRMVERSDLGFYIVNPDSDLTETEKKLVKFLDKRIPEWKGIAGHPPSSDEFAAALAEQNVLLYCGHGSGTKHLPGEKIQQLRVVALPLLFGCSSVTREHLGGRVQYTGVSDKYMIAGSACMVGMIWPVTTGDTDNMTATLLNNWLPGEPADLEELGFGATAPSKEPELLRVLKPARDSAKFYMNSAALVARGIPVKMKYK